MQIKELLEFINNTSFYNAIDTSKIPNINLYMDQVLTFMNENLSFYNKNPKDKSYTKSMVNNYVKNEIIPKPENKKYFPHHIISLIYVFYLKQILSLEDIKSICQPYTDKFFNIESMIKMYDKFLEYEKSNIENIVAEIKSLAEKIDTDDTLSDFSEDEKFFMFMMLISSRATTYKFIVEKILEKNS